MKPTAKTSATAATCRRPRRSSGSASSAMRGWRTPISSTKTLQTHQPGQIQPSNASALHIGQASLRCQRPTAA
jgi:hypothetical protein